MKLRKCLSVLLALVIVFCLSACGGNAESNADTSATSGPDASVNITDSDKDPSQKILVAYFSATGTTKTIAGYIKDAVGADVFEITPSLPYTAEDLNYSDTDSRSTSEQHNEDARPPITGTVENSGDYDILFIGYPIWFGEAPRVISTFLEGCDLKGKTIIPFCTSGSSDIGSSATNLHKLSPDAIWQDGKRFAGSAEKESVAEWANSVILKTAQ